MDNLIVRPLTSREYPMAARAIAAALADDDSREQALYHLYAQVYPKRPDPLPDVYRAACIGDTPVALAHLSGHTLRYGRAALNVVIINNLLTLPDYRGRGYAGALLRDTLTHAAEHNAQLVLVDARVPDFFGRYGFSPVWPRYTLQADSEQAAALEAPYQLQVATRDALPSIANLYNHHWGRRVTTERSAAVWRWLINYRRDAAIVVVDGIGQVRGYLWHRDNPLSDEVEIVADDAAAVQTLLAYGGRRWLADGQRMFTWRVPPDDTIIAHARHLIPVTLSARYAPNSGSMARIIDADGLVRRLLPEISAQGEIDPAQLILAVEPDGVTIGLRGMPDSHSRLALRDFIQLVFGSLRPELSGLGAPPDDGARHLLAGLFPPRIATLGMWDH